MHVSKYMDIRPKGILGCIGRDGDAARAEPMPTSLVVLRSVLRSGVRQIALTRRELQN